MGPDLIVFENPFYYNPKGPSAQTTTYNEAAYVEVSEDGNQFYRFPFSVAAEKDLWALDRYHGLAGIQVQGDFFDLQTILETYQLPSSFRACYVKIIDAGTEILDADADSHINSSSGADIDAVQALHFELR